MFLELSKYLKKASKVRPYWSKPHPKADPEDYKGKHITFKKEDVALAEEKVRERQHRFISAKESGLWLILLIPCIIGGPIFVFLWFTILMLYKAFTFNRH